MIDFFWSWSEAVETCLIRDKKHADWESILLPPPSFYRQQDQTYNSREWDDLKDYLLQLAMAEILKVAPMTICQL